MAKPESVLDLAALPRVQEKDAKPLEGLDIAGDQCRPVDLRRGGEGTTPRLFFDAVEEGETVRVYRTGRSVADIVPVKAVMPAWKKPPEARLSLGSLSLGDEILADRDEKRGSGRIEDRKHPTR